MTSLKCPFCDRIIYAKQDKCKCGADVNLNLKNGTVDITGKLEE